MLYAATLGTWLQLFGLALDFVGFTLLALEWRKALLLQYDQAAVSAAEGLELFRARCAAAGDLHLMTDSFKKYEQSVADNLISALSRTGVGVPLHPETLDVTSTTRLLEAFYGGQGRHELLSAWSREMLFRAGAALVLLGIFSQAIGTWLAR